MQNTDKPGGFSFLVAEKKNAGTNPYFLRDTPGQRYKSAICFSWGTAGLQKTYTSVYRYNGYIGVFL